MKVALFLFLLEDSLVLVRDLSILAAAHRRKQTEECPGRKYEANEQGCPCTAGPIQGPPHAFPPARCHFHPGTIWPGDVSCGSDSVLDSFLDSSLCSFSAQPVKAAAKSRTIAMQSNRFIIVISP